MTIKAIKAVSSGQVSFSSIGSSFDGADGDSEWPRRIHFAVQEVGLPLLRLGWKLQGHEVSHEQEKAGGIMLIV